MSTSEQTTTTAKEGCTAPTPTPCPYGVYADRMCEGHYRRTLRAQDSGRPANLTTHLREPRGPLTAVHTRIRSTAHLYYFTHEAGEYEALRQVLESHAEAKLGEMSPEEQAALPEKAKALKKKKRRERSRRKVA